VEELKAEDEQVRLKLSRSLVLGKEAYSCGEYPAAVELLEQAVDELGTTSQLGGEAQLWLALAYQVGSAVQSTNKVPWVCRLGILQPKGGSTTCCDARGWVGNRRGEGGSCDELSLQPCHHIMGLMMRLSS
jgi:hypothetical protein